MKLKISTSGYAGLGQFVVFLFNIRTVAHVMHLRTESFAEHKALNDFYDAVVGLADRFAETATGIFKRIEDFPPALNMDIPVDSIGFLKTVAAALTEEMRRPEIALHKDLENIAAEILELCNGTIYKLEQLH